MAVADELEMDRVINKLYSSIVIRVMKNVNCITKIDVIIHACRLLAMNFSALDFVHSKRQANTVAHKSWEPIKEIVPDRVNTKYAQQQSQ